MQKEVENVLKRSFPVDELSLYTYYKNCDVYVISSERNCYQLSREIKIDFTIASIAIVKDNYEICLFTTDREYRNMGYGLKLLQCLYEIYGKLKLYVRVSNKGAINLYEKFGFIIIDIIPNFYSYTRTNEDAYEMHLD